MTARHQLDGTKKYQLRKFLESHKQEVQTRTKPDLVKFISGALGFEVTIGNVEGAASDVGISLLPGVSSNGLEPLFRHQRVHNDLCEIVAEIAKRLGETDLCERAMGAKCRIGAQKEVKS